MILKRYIPALLIIAAIFFSCKSDYEKEVEKSKKLSNHLRTEKLPSYDILYKQIIQNKTNPNSDVLLVDSLYRSTKEITKIIDSLIIVIETIDSTGESREVGKSLLVTSPVGLRLTNGANSVYQYCLELIKDENKKKILKEQFLKYRGYLGTIEFNKVYFSKSSSSFIVMTLIGLKNDLIKATHLSLDYIDKFAAK
jgi:hypothetical protein